MKINYPVINNTWLPWAVLALVHLLVVMAGFNNHTTCVSDSTDYLDQATNLRSHLTFYCGSFGKLMRPDLFSARPPGYGLFLSPLSFGVYPLMIPVLLQVILSLLTIYISWRCVQLITKSEIGAWTYLLPLTAFATQFIYSGMIMSEILFQFFLMLVLLCGLMFHHSDKFKWVIAFQVMVTIALLIKPVMWLLPVLSFPVAVWMVSRKGYPVKLLVTFLIPFVIISAMFYRNYSLTGVAEYSSISRKLLVNYNVASLLEAQKGSAEAYRIIDSLQTAVSDLDYKSRTAAVDEFVTSQIFHSPAEYSLLHLKGLLRFFFDTGRWEWRRYFQPHDNWKGTEQYKSTSGYLQQWSPSAIFYQVYCMGMNLIMVFTLLWFAFVKSVDYRDRRILVGLVMYVALLTGPSASARFRLPVFPMQMIAMGVFIGNRKNGVSATPLKN